MNNKEAFTLVELLVVLVIIGAILVFAIPNVTNTIQRAKKEQIIEDGKNAIEKAKVYTMIKGYPTKEEQYKLNEIDKSNVIKESPYGDYDRDNSYVKVELEEVDKDNHIFEYVYKVYLETENQKAKLNESTLKDLSAEENDELYERVKIE